MRLTSAYARARQQGHEAVRQALLDAASQLLVEEGPQALTVRRISAAVGCSTTVLYRLFGSKDGVADALYREGFERLSARLQRVSDEADPAESPMQRAAGMARAYRESALADRNYYGVMFGSAIPGFKPSAEALAIGNASLDMLAQAVAEAMDEGFLVNGDPVAVAEVLWAAAHGVVSLEISGHLDSAVAAERYATLVRAAISPFVAEPMEKDQ